MKYKLTIPIDKKKIEKPYIKGVRNGILIGMSITKILFDAYINNYRGIIIGLSVLIIGLFLSIKGGING